MILVMKLRRHLVLLAGWICSHGMRVADQCPQCDQVVKGITCALTGLSWSVRHLVRIRVVEVSQNVIDCVSMSRRVLT